LLLKLAESPGSFHLILTDVAMPDVNGLEVLRYVRSQPALQALPVIMMSAHENAGTVFECVKQGAEDYLLKPVTQKEIKQIWQHVWRRRSTLTKRTGAGAAPAAQPRLEMPPESYEKPNTPSAGSKGEDDTELYTAAEMKAHCQRQLARYTRILHVIDTHPHLFPAAAEPKPEDAAAAAKAAQEP
jgi:DNA-binding response OmpR family regulator